VRRKSYARFEDWTPLRTSLEFRRYRSIEYSLRLHRSTRLSISLHGHYKRHLHARLRRRLILGDKWLNIPNALSVLVNAPVTREETHARHSGDALRCPLLRVLIAFVDELLCLDVRVEVVRDEVVVAVLDNAVDQRGEALTVAEPPSADAVENGGELRVELVVRVDMGVAQVFHIFSEVAEEEDVLLANLTGDFDLARG
jgi:hypothetical protein